MTAYDRVRRTVGEINDLLCTLNFATWDARVQMPARGGAARGRQLATLAGVARERATSNELASAVDEALPLAENEDERAELQRVRDAVATLRRLPDGLVDAIAGHRATAQDAWEAAKAANDFAVFVPALRETLRLQRTFADALGWEEHPYDALVAHYEPGMTTARVRALLSRLREGLLPLLDAIVAKGVPEPEFRRKEVGVEAQRVAALHFARIVGYDLDRGRLDASAHPFEISFTRDDVRITTRYRTDYFPMSLFGTLHEAGHALYEQGVDPRWVRTAFTTDIVGLYAVAGTSYGAHESQSRLIENQLGRSAPFWDAHYAELLATHGDALDGVDVNAFVRGINHVAPSPTRVEADELTYDLHIMLRVEIEAALLDGTLAAEDVPKAWAEKTEELLGLEVTDDRSGALQDIHWSAGLVGAFPTYTFGNVMSAQWMAAARERDPAVAPALERGDSGPLRAWLHENVHRHGRRYLPDELLGRATGSGLDPEPYLAYLREKYTRLYAL